MNDLDYDSARIVEEIQQGLKHLDEEEENLVVLRDQLTKVKRFREEQARKDDMIATLQERMRQLEYEKEFGIRQSAELEEIMSERILTLERSLAERDEVERQFLEFQVQAEVIEMERDSLKSELHAEKERYVIRNCLSPAFQTATPTYRFPLQPRPDAHGVYRPGQQDPPPASRPGARPAGRRKDTYAFRGPEDRAAQERDRVEHCWHSVQAVQPAVQDRACSGPQGCGGHGRAANPARGGEEFR